MTDPSAALPRRALPPEGAPSAPSPGRRWLSPPPPEPGDDGIVTPVPPPVTAPPSPVLPLSERHAAPGHRFSADELPDDWAGTAPRHSATSPTGLGWSARAPRLGERPSGAHAIGRAPEPAGSRATSPAARWFWPVVVVAVVAAVVLVATLISRAVRPGGTADAATARAALLSQPADLAGLRPGTSWSATDDAAPDESKGIRCVLPSSQLSTPPLDRTVVRRTLTATSGDPATLIEQVETYADVDTATQAFASRSAQLGGCAGSPDLVNAGYAPSGLGDQAVAVRVTEQDSAAAVHDLVAVRSGTTVVIADAQAGRAAPDLNALAHALVPALGRVCAGSSGGCPGSPAVADAGLPAADPAGFLAPGDLPRVSVGAGTWVGAELRPMKLAGSGCEGVDLTQVPKATLATQRSYVLTGDPHASPHFGVDEIVYTFGSDADAAAFVQGVTASVSGCFNRLKTYDVSVLGRPAAPASGQLFTVDRRATLEKAARSRVFVAALGTHAVYLSANPTPDFDLSDAAWLAVGQRAISRATQLPAR